MRAVIFAVALLYAVSLGTALIVAHAVAAEDAQFWDRIAGAIK